MSGTTIPIDDTVPSGAPSMQPIVLADTAYERFLTTGDVGATNEAIELYQTLFDEAEHSLTEPEAGRAEGVRIAGKLSTVLIQRFEHLGNIDDMKRAVEVQTKAVAMVLTDPSNQALRAESMSGLGRALTSQFERTGDAVDAELAVEYFDQALERVPQDSVNRSIVLGDIAKAYLARYQHFDNEVDLNTAIDNSQRAISTIPPQSPEHAPLANVLGKALLARFERTRSSDDINSAVTHLSAAASQTSATNPDKPKRLGHYGDALLARFQAQGNGIDLQEAIDAQTRAHELLDPKNVALSDVSGSLASGYYARYKHLGRDVADLDEAIKYFKTAVELTLFASPAYARVTDQLATAFVSKYQVAPNIEALDYAIMLHRQAVGLTPGDSRHRLERVKNLGYAYVRRYRSQHGSQLVDDRNGAIEAFTEALDIIGGNANHPVYSFIMSEFGRIGHTIP